MELVEDRVLLTAIAMDVAPVRTIQLVEHIQLINVDQARLVNVDQGGWINVSAGNFAFDLGAANAPHVSYRDVTGAAAQGATYTHKSSDSLLTLSGATEQPIRVVFQQPAITPATEGGFAQLQLGQAEVGVARIGVASSRETIAGGAIAPASARPTLMTEMPLEAARGRSQAFELSGNFPQSDRSAPVNVAGAVDAAMKELARSGMELSADASTDFTQANLGLSSRGLAPESSVAVRRAEQATSSNPGLPGSVFQFVSHDSQAALPIARVAASPVAPAEPVTDDAQLADSSLGHPPVAPEATNLAHAPGASLFVIMVSLTGFHWQRSRFAGQNVPGGGDGEPIEPKLRRRTVPAKPQN
jgi:hypothetical protein